MNWLAAHLGTFWASIIMVYGTIACTTVIFWLASKIKGRRKAQ